MKLSGESQALLLQAGLMVLGVAAGLWVLNRLLESARSAASEVLPRVAEAFNPVSDQNLAYQGAGAVLDDPPGIWLHKVLNPEYEAWTPNAPTHGASGSW